MPCATCRLLMRSQLNLGRVHGNEGVKSAGSLASLPRISVDPVDLRVVEVDRASDVGLERTT